MSRIGRKEVLIPSGVQVASEGNLLKVKGPKGELAQSFPDEINVQLESGKSVLFGIKTETKSSKALHGLSRSLCFNMMEGVTKGFSKSLEIQGVGFRAKIEGKNLVLALGFTHSVEYPIPAGIKIDVEEQVRMKISGVDKQLVGQVAAEIRRFLPPEPYKGKGIRYAGEHVKKKAGKTVA
ncbi:MAG: 50S ribosomal protein L6 [Chlamydiae bacterium]|nr:50S ribosomal protein L6 [Chlamydiota bacterium]MBI3277747.1 50S ribosomal protein L6 [Chlamydiota bacterium]